MLFTRTRSCLWSKYPAMQMTPAILLALAILAFAIMRMPDRIKPGWLQRINWWQKLAGLVAVILAVLVLMNPEFLALGILGDAAFFDGLVLLFSLQLQESGARAWHYVGPMLSRAMRWVVTPSPGMYYLLTVSALALGSAGSTVQKIVHRISS